MYFTMELLQGISLEKLIKTEGTVPYPRAVRIAVQCCHSLSEAHRHGIWHRDMKPENVIITQGKRGRDHVKILDFGIAKVRGENQTKTQTGTIFGTPRYLSPEQTNDLEVDHRTDIYTLGVILYEMLMGEAPFDGESMVSVLMDIVQKPPPTFSEKNPAVQVPESLEDVIRCSLAKYPGDRPASAEAFATALMDAIGEDSDTALDIDIDEEEPLDAGDGGASDSVPITLPWEEPEETLTGEIPAGTEGLGTGKVDLFMRQIEESATARDLTSPVEDPTDDDLFVPGAFRADHRQGFLIGAAVLLLVLGLLGLGFWQPWAPAPTDDTAVPVDVVDVVDIVDIVDTQDAARLDVAQDAPVDMAALPDVTDSIAPDLVPPEVVSTDVPRVEVSPSTDAVPNIVDVAPADIAGDRAVTREVFPADVPTVKDVPKKPDPPKEDPHTPKEDPPKDPGEDPGEDEYTEIPIGV